ncbi:MAG: hypothetical protein ACFFED_17345 [Candidatus Thorarchaeota archaeon]
MEISCGSCGNGNWKVKIFEMRVMGQSIVYSALKCESCGSIYPLQELGKNVSKDAITSMLKE